MNTEEVNKLGGDFIDAIKRGDIECVQEMINEYSSMVDLVNRLDPSNK